MLRLRVHDTFLGGFKKFFSNSWVFFYMYVDVNMHMRMHAGALLNVDVRVRVGKIF
jgi:hypothetical protein